MPCIVPIIEGHGEKDAVPLLLRRILSLYEMWHWSVAKPIQVGNLNKLKLKLSSFIKYALKYQDCAGILILLDLDDGCPALENKKLSELLSNLYLNCPVPVVFAHREYEAWFLASIETIANDSKNKFPKDLTFSKDVESKRGVKEWLSSQLPSGYSYKPTVDQARFTNLIDICIAQQRSRSFKRLCHAVEQIVKN
ncbi:hypothetical protein MHK_008468 [Candidatus Magnetomorum sp. HK-1]|nr:hypothetical protein MHK_008468 [Candidatus Magnetomorum sp. HK-1]